MPSLKFNAACLLFFTTQSLLLFYPGDLVFNWVSVLNWQKPIQIFFFCRELLDVFFTFISPPICRSICAAAEIKGLGRVSAAGPHRAAPPAYSRRPSLGNNGSGSKGKTPDEASLRIPPGHFHFPRGFHKNNLSPM